MRSRILLAALLAGQLAVVGCGGSEKAAEWAPADSASADEGDAGFGRQLAGGAPAPEPSAPPGADGDELLAFAGPHDLLGRADGQTLGLPGEKPEGPKPEPKEPAQGGPLLIYQATVHLAVHEVVSRQRAVLEIAKELGGFLAAQDDRRIVVRVPARRFAEALAKVETVGDLLHKNVQADDVSEQYRDLSLRLRNAEVVRDRLEELLKKADKVEDALKVAKELSDVTEKIELLKGKLRFLQDRIALSTITVLFQPKATQTVEPQGARLPFGFLDELGLQSLFDLHSSY